jgi:hypothetical protein
MKKVASYLLWVGILATLAIPAFAETRTISWAAVTTYTDGTPFEAGKTVSYSVYWTTDPGLGSLHTIGTSLATTSTTFDPDVQRMNRGGTVYFTLKAVLSTSEVSAFSPAYSWVVPVVTPPVVTLTAVTVSGPSSVNEGGTGTYTATATWSDGTNTSVTPAWSVSPTTYASISSGGVLTTLAVTANQAVTVTATYGGRTGTRTVTIVDVPGTAPAAPKNIGITGPISTGTSQVWRLAWNPVTTYANGGPLEPGRTVRYTVYWTDDPALTAGSLRLLASSVFANTVDFDPLGYPMVKNQVIYLTAQSILDTGEQSSLAASIEWVVANAGPAPPASGSIIKR